MRKLKNVKIVRAGRPKPSKCWSCGKSDQLVYDNGEWKCARCHVVVE